MLAFFIYGLVTGVIIGMLVGYFLIPEPGDDRDTGGED
jgi:hypothetical protein